MKFGHTLSFVHIVKVELVLYIIGKVKVFWSVKLEDQVDVIHAISPIWVKLGQIEGHTQ